MSCYGRARRVVGHVKASPGCSDEEAKTYAKKFSKDLTAFASEFETRIAKHDPKSTTPLPDRQVRMAPAPAHVLGFDSLIMRELDKRKMFNLQILNRDRLAEKPVPQPKTQVPRHSASCCW